MFVLLIVEGQQSFKCEITWEGCGENFDGKSLNLKEENFIYFENSKN